MKDEKKNSKLKALVLAGGYDQIALIKELKKRDYEVLLADYFENPPAKRKQTFLHRLVLWMKIEYMNLRRKKESIW